MNARRLLLAALCALALGGLTAAPAAVAAPPALQQLGAAGPRDEGALPPVSKEAGSTRIVGGVATTGSKYPWQSLLEITNSEGSFSCGGTLIHPFIVLTAAHCLANDSGELEFGTEVLSWFGRTDRESGGFADEAFNLWMPNAYDPFTHEYDFAFVSLWAGTDLPRLQLAGPTERALWTPGRLATITGWGDTSEGGDPSSVLNEAQVPIVDDATCAQSAINDAGFEPLTMVCAGPLAGGVDTCQGDSGGPLQAPIDGGGFRLVGVTSWGYGCARPNKPGVYTRVASDPIERFIAEVIPLIESEDEIPVTGVSVTGAGARPPGCGVAESQLAAATTGSASAGAALASSQGTLHKARVAKAKASRKAKAAKRRGGRELSRAKKRLRSASRRLKTSQKRVSTANESAAAAAAALAAAGANRAAVCG